MPFTFSHPAAVVPLRRYGILSALVVGSMMPDVLHLVPMLPRSNFGHSVEGVFLFCLPAGLITLWLFHAFLKRPVITLLPISLQEKLSRYDGQFAWLPGKRLLLIIFSILLGSFTHIFWDSFTHSDGWFVQNWEALRGQVHFGSRYHLSIADLFQQISTVTGVALLLLWTFLWIRQTPSTRREGVRYLSKTVRVFILGFVMVGALAPAAYFFAQNPDFWNLHERRLFLGVGATRAIKVLFLELIIFALFWHWQLKPSLIGGKSKKNPF